MVISKQSNFLTNFLLPIRENRFFVISVIFLVIGMFCGAILVGNLNDTYIELLKKMVVSFVDFRQSAGLVNIFFNVFFTLLFSIIIVLALAFSVSGLTFIPIFVFLRGFGTCVIASVFYREFSLHGIAFANLILLPSCLAFDFLILHYTSEAMNLSSKFFNLVRDCSSRGIEIRPHCISFLQKTIKCLMIGIIITFVESFFNLGFIKFFEFNL